MSVGKSNAPIQDKTISIYYGHDFLNIQCINFVSMAEDPVETAKARIYFYFEIILHLLIFKIIDYFKGMGKFFV